MNLSLYHRRANTWLIIYGTILINEAHVIDRNSNPFSHYPIDFPLQDHSNLGQGLLGEKFEKWALEKAVLIMKSAGLNPKPPPMKKVMLTGEAMCNDGSPAGFYYRVYPNSRRWIIFLEGGWYCYDNSSCLSRLKTSKNLMTSEGWTEYHEGRGILSDNPEENPHWWRSNHVYIPYCSSDCWTGKRRGSVNSTNSLINKIYIDKLSGRSVNDIDRLDAKSLHFMGAIILESVINKLIDLGLDRRHTVVLSGSSAGGIGVFMNLDKVHDQLTASLGKDITVKGLVDSAWFLNTKPFIQEGSCQDVQSCSVLLAMRSGYNVWNAQIPKSCINHNKHDPWSCFLGYKILPYIKQSIFIFQWTFDEIQLLMNNVGKPITKEHWNYIHQIGQKIKKSFWNIRNVFAPSCISHTSITQRNWNKVRVNGVLLPDALNCWVARPNNQRNNINHRFSSFMRNTKGRRKQPPTSTRNDVIPSTVDVKLTNNAQNSTLRRISRPKKDRGRRRKRKKRLENKKHRSITVARTSTTQSKHQKTSEGNNKSMVLERDFTVLALKKNKSKNKMFNMLSDAPKIAIYKGENGNIASRKRTKNKRRKSRHKKRRKKNREKKLKESKKNARRNIKGRKNIAKTRTLRSSFHPILEQQQFSVPSKNVVELDEKPTKIVERNGRFDQNRDDESRCQSHLVDECSWPHCNPTCPPLINPYTGEEMHRVELLKSFGLNMVDLANALGIDLFTLNSMDNKDIFRMLSP